ncbi:MAG: hypothetical protein M1822_002509 [Bathelium mastoideum]|nr:MAG: hypothetical protein M1822_002509 [Bathelium mastoideum]
MGPTRIEAFGREFTTGSVYISYPGAYALNYGGVQCGARHGSGYLTLPSSSLFSFRSSIVSGRGLTSQYSFNFGDLPPNPVPADAWWGANGQATITDADYTPAIADAIYFRALDPAWSDCAIQTFGVQDPPYALTQEAFAAAPSNVGAQPTAEPQSIVSATPASGISMSAATQTVNTATGGEDPKEPQDNTSSSRLSQLPQTTRTGKSAVISDPATHRSSTKDPVDSSGRHVNVSPTASDEFSSASPPQPDQEQSAAVFSTPAGSVSQLDGQGASVGYPSDTTESRVIRHPQSLPVESSTDDIASLSSAVGRMSDDGPALTEVGSITISMSAGSSKFVSAFGGLAISAGSSGAIVISSATYQVGDVMTLAGTPVSAISHGLVVPSEMASVPTSTSNDAPANLISASIDPGPADQATPASRTGGRFSSSRQSSDVHSARISENQPYSDASARSRQELGSLSELSRSLNRVTSVSLSDAIKNVTSAAVSATQDSPKGSTNIGAGATSSLPASGYHLPQFSASSNPMSNPTYSSTSSSALSSGTLVVQTTNSGVRSISSSNCKSLFILHNFLVLILLTL